MENYWQIIIPIIAGFVSALGGYISGRKQQKREIEKSGLDNLEKSIEIYRKMLDDVAKRLSTYIEEAELKFAGYEAEIKTLKGQLKNQNAYIKKLETTKIKK